MSSRNIQYGISAALVGVLLGGCEPGSAPDPYMAAHNTHEVMTWVLDPAADQVWASAGQIITEAETVDLAPTTDEGWNEVRYSATVVAEAGNLLMLPAHARDQEDWVAFSRGLFQAGMMAEQAAQAHDADALFDAGGVIYNVCVACHQLYATEVKL
jgi:hypothetical protein